MNINTNVYGLPETWESYSSEADHANVKVPHWGTDSDRKTWLNGFYYNNLILNEQIDLSLAHWGINGKSGLATKKFYLPYGTADSSTITDLKSGTLDVYRDNGKTLPAIFQYSPSQGGEQYMTVPNYQFAYNAQTANAYGLYGAPLLDFKYNKIVVVPMIVCGYLDPYQTGGFTARTCTIREYFDTYKTTYPYILQIYINSSEIYYGQIDEDHSYRYRMTYGAICQCDTRDKIGYPYMYNNVSSENRINFLDLIPYSMTICGIDANTYPPYWQPTSFPQNETISLNDSFAMNSTNYNHCRFMCDNGKFKLKATNSGRTPYITAYWENATEEEVLQEVAYLGFWFADNHTSANNSASGQSCTDDGLYLPKFDADGVTTGEYWQGSDAGAHAPADDKTPRELYDYDPNAGGGGDTDQDTGDLDNQQLHNLRYNGSNNYYLLTESELSQFIGFINGLYTGESDPEKKRSIDFMGSNPTDYIIGIYGCGIELTGGATTSIKLGAVDTADAGIFGEAVPTNLTYVNFGDYDIPAYGNFLDFKPYTTIEVYVPLCGTIEVDPGEYIGHNLKVDGLIDYQTGELTARIVRDGKTVTNTLTGSMWVQLPVTAAKMGDYQNNQHQLRMQMLSSILSFGQSSANAINSDVQSAAGAIAGSAAGGSPTALATPGKAQFTIPQNAASTALSLYNTHYQITHTQPARATASSASAGNALEMYHHAMIFIKRPTFLNGYDQAKYAHTIGHACCISAKLSSFSGYTVFSAADLDDIHTKRELNPLQATAQEKQLLKQALQSGIYINTISPE